MTPQPDSYIVVSLIEQQKENNEFERSKWPLHTTVVPWFSFDDYNSLTKSIERIARSLKVFTAETGSREMFGPNKDIPVNIYKEQSTFENIHKELIDELQKIGIEFQEREWMGKNFRAHVTRLKERTHQLEENNQITINNLCLAQLTAPTRCKILRVFKFGNQSETTA